MSEQPKRKQTRFAGALAHITRLEDQTEVKVQAAASALHVGGRETPDGACAAWEYWGDSTYYETGPDGSYTGGYWASDC